MTKDESGLIGQAEGPRFFNTWLLIVLSVVWTLPRATTVIANYVVDQYKFNFTRPWALFGSNLYLISSLVVLLVPFIVHRGTQAKITIRNIFSRERTPLILLAFLPEVVLIVQSIYFHKGLSGAYTGEYFVRSAWLSFHSVHGTWHWITTWGQLILEGMSLVWLKVLLIGVSDRGKAIYLFGGFELTTLIINVFSNWLIVRQSIENGTWKYSSFQFSTALIFWNVIECIAAIWIASMLTEAFRPKLSAIAILFYAPVIAHHFFSNGAGWTFRAATEIPAIIIWAILSRSNLKVSPWYNPPPIDDEALQS
ncbi:MAG: hypothetical protein WCI55_05415 [Armatimonadota bacterium]